MPQLNGLSAELPEGCRSPALANHGAQSLDIGAASVTRAVRIPQDRPF